MAIDVKNHRLFLGCTTEKMVMMDNTNGKVVATVPIGQGVDANAFDPGTATRLCFLRRRHDDDCEGRNAGQIDRGPDAENPTRLADHGAGPDDAQNLPGGGQIRGAGAR